MNPDHGLPTRRRFLALGAAGIAMLPLSQWTARAADLPKLEESDPAAQAQGYAHDATTVDKAKYPKKAEKNGAYQRCDTCQFYQGQSPQEWGPCVIFPGKAVAAKGWCNAWSGIAG
ncbi:MAG: high-potential iron-sulfur protein [Gammaproteobacteria bacterium]